MCRERLPGDMGAAAPSECVMYVRSQPLDARSEFPILPPWSPTRLFGTALAGAAPYRTDAESARSGTPPKVGLPRQQSQCLAMVLDLARRARRTVRVVDVSRESVPREVVEDPGGEPRFFPILVRPDGAQLSGEEEFTPSRVKRFLARS